MKTWRDKDETSCISQLGAIVYERKREDVTDEEKRIFHESLIMTISDLSSFKSSFSVAHKVATRFTRTQDLPGSYASQIRPKIPGESLRKSIILHDKSIRDVPAKYYTFWFFFYARKH